MDERSVALKVGDILKAKDDGEQFRVTSIYDGFVSYVALIPIHAWDDSDWWADMEYIMENFTW